MPYRSKTCAVRVPFLADGTASSNSSSCIANEFTLRLDGHACGASPDEIGRWNVPAGAVGLSDHQNRCFLVGGRWQAQKRNSGRCALMRSAWRCAIAPRRQPSASQQTQIQNWLCNMLSSRSVTRKLDPVSPWARVGFSGPLQKRARTPILYAGRQPPARAAAWHHAMLIDSFSSFHAGVLYHAEGARRPYADLDGRA